MPRLLLFTLLCAFFIGCAKQRARKFAGTYSVTKDYKYNQNGQSPVHNITELEWEIQHSGTLVITPEGQFESNELIDGNTAYIGHPSSFSTLRIKDDSLFYYSVNQAQAANSTTSVVGVKIK